MKGHLRDVYVNAGAGVDDGESVRVETGRGCGFITTYLCVCIAFGFVCCERGAMRVVCVAP